MLQAVFGRDQLMDLGVQWFLHELQGGRTPPQDRSFFPQTLFLL